MSAAIENIRTKLPRILKDGTERTLYPELCPFIVAVANEEPVNKKGVEASAEESSTQHESGVGFPDITVRHGKEIVGWIEVKLPGKALDHQSYVQQFLKYKSSLENVIFTNLQEWELWQWDRSDKEKPNRIKRITFDLTQGDSAENQKDFLDMLIHFFEYQPTLAKTPKQLALALARKTRLLSQQVEEAVKTAEKEDEKENELLKLKDLFEKTLIQDLEVHQFANMVAETVAYSLFLSRLEHEERGKEKDFTLTTANDYIPESVPILSDLYQLISKVSKEFPSIYSAGLALLEQLNRADIQKIRSKLTEHKVGEDPVIHFYEPFLAEFDPAERKRRGVYYTPKPVVDFIVRSVDSLLRDNFKKEMGVADESVHILDPATGTGTFLLSMIQQVYATVKEKNEGLGEVVVKKEFQRLTANHILKHFYGFELLAAPYAIAHLKLTLEIERLGFVFEQTNKDGDSDNDRFKIYLANTLDDPNQPPKLDLPGYHIAAETNEANEIKRLAPVIAIIGNPPYSLVSSNLLPHMRELVEKYKFIDKKKIKERGALQLEKILNDDYVKFISFGQNKINQTGYGILALINNHTFLDNPTMRAMRHNLLNDFSEIIILNLHGNHKQRGQEIDENVFDIQQGVSINIFIKSKNQQGPAKVFYKEIKGTRKSKLELLINDCVDADRTDYVQLQPKAPNYFFVPKNDALGGEYEKFISITDALKLKSIGFFTSRDHLVISHEPEQNLEKISHFKNSTESNEELCNKLQIPLKKGWNVTKARENIKAVDDLKKHLVKFLHRPFDKKYVFYHKSLVWSMSRPVNQNMMMPNLALCVSRQLASLPWQHVFCSNSIVELCYITNKTKEGNHVFPLYTFEESNQTSILEEMNKLHNFTENFVELASERLGLQFVPCGRGDLSTTFGPEDLYYYIYGLLHSSTYRERYKEFLKTDFPRIAVTSNKMLFGSVREKGCKLVNLHLLGENPFDDSSKSIFEDTNKWNVRVGGECPVGLDDWKVTDIRYEKDQKRVYVNDGQYFEGIEPEIWDFYIGGYQVPEKWLKDRRKADRSLSVDDLKHYMKIIVSLRETIRLMKEIDETIDANGGWPIQ